MYIAMNEFPVNEDRHEEFETIWKTRERFLQEMEGFISFKLLKGKAEEGTRLYISHATWKDEESFMNWVHSDAFKKAHKNRTPSGIIQGHPNFRGYEVILEE